MNAYLSVEDEKMKMSANKCLSCFFCSSLELKLADYKRSVVWDEREFGFYRCPECGAFSLYPLLDDTDLAKLYDQNYLDFEEFGQIESQWMDMTESSSRGWKYSLHFLKTNSTKPLRVLDFGCGPNSPLMKLAGDLGHRVVGVEYDNVVCRIAETNTGAKVYSFSDFEKGNDSYDFIFLGDVLEHLSPPDKTIQLLRRRLETGGKLVLQGPLEGGFSMLNLVLAIFARLRRRHTNQPPFHVSLATKESLTRFVGRHNMKVDHLRISHTYWPAPEPQDLFKHFSISRLILFLTQTTDALLARIMKKHGNRFFLVASAK